MPHVILSNLQILLFFFCFVIENSKKVLIRRLAVSSIIVYYNSIIQNTFNIIADYMEFSVIKG